MTSFYRALGSFCARKPYLVLCVALVASALSVVLATRIEMRTGMQDLQAETNHYVERLAYLNENFPSSVTALVVVEGHDVDRLIQVGKELEEALLKDREQVRAVYFEEEVDFFARRALLFLPPDDLRYALSTLEENGPALAALAKDPSLLGLLRTSADLSENMFAAQSSIYSLNSNISAVPNWTATQNGNPSATTRFSVNTDPLRKRLREQNLKTLENAPLPPSNVGAKQNLDAALVLFELIADVLEQGDAITQGEFHARLSALRDKGLEHKDSPERFRISSDKTMLLLEVAGEQNLADIPNIIPFDKHLRAVVKNVQENHPDVTIGMTGLPIQTLEEQFSIVDNFLLVSLLGLLGILAVFIIGFERVALPTLSLIPLLMGVLWTFGVQGALRPELNLLNLMFPVVLFGLGIDFAIHIISNFTQRRDQGDDRNVAMQDTFGHVVPSLVTGAFTTACAFLVLLMADMKGLQDLGFTAGVGVLMSLFSMLFVLPAVLSIYDRLQTRDGSSMPNVRFGFLNKTGDFLRAFRYPVLALFLTLSIALAYFVPRVSLDRDALNLQPKDMASTVLYKRVFEKFNQSGTPSVIFAKDLAEIRRITDAVLASKTISDPVSIANALPKDQAQKAALISSFDEALKKIVPEEPPIEHEYNDDDIRELRKRLAEIKGSALQLSALASVLYKSDTRAQVGALRDVINRIDRRLISASQKRLTRLDSMIREEVTFTHRLFADMTQNRELTIDDLPASIIERVRGKDGQYMVMVRGKGYVYDIDFLSNHVGELKSISDNHTGLIPIWSDMLDNVATDLPKLTLFTILIVALIVFIGLRSPKGTVVALVPLLVGLLWTFGVLGLFNVKLNLISILAIPLIIGIGIDDGVHLYHRIKIEKHLGTALEHSGKAVILTSLTTGIGFGSLMLSVHRGVFFLGLTTAIGIVSCLIVSLFLMPALVAIFQEDILRTKD